MALSQRTFRRSESTVTRLASDPGYREIMTRHLRPGDEAALLRFADALSELGDEAAQGSKFWQSLFASAAVRAAAEYARGAAFIHACKAIRRGTI